MKKLRIVFVTNNYTPYSGGVVSSINASVHELHKVGHEVTIITLDFLGAQHNNPDYVIRVPCPIKFRYKTNPMAVPWWPQHHLYKIIKRFEPDIIHAHHPFLLGSEVLRVAKKLNIPIVFTYHTLYEAYLHYIPLPQFLTRYVTKRLVRSFCQRVDGIIAPSRAIKEYLQNAGVKTKTTIIPSSLQQQFLTNKKPEKDISTNRPFRLLTVGRFVKEKNIPLLFDVFQLLQGNYTLTLVGYGAEYETIKSMAYEQYQFTPDRVRFIHKPPQEQIIRLYREADLFLFSSTTDTQGLVLVEAMARATPVIAIDGPGQRDVIRNGQNGFLVESADKMAKMIDFIAQNNDLQVRLQDEAWKTAQKYEPEGLIEQLVDFYEQVMICTKGKFLIK